ncbi:MAG: copper chaperone PCu(A)C [Gemmatimonadetes bacterium]|nr:copper chaperone PCu(A)C [Gemmatimonadota bacterium]
MMPTARLFHVALLSATVALASSAAPAITNALLAQNTAITAHDAWAREAAAGRTVTAVFVTVENSGATRRSIVSGKTDVADTLELHEMKANGSMMQMSPVKSIDVPAHGKVELKPGSLHIMLFGLKKPLTTGDTVKMTLTLDDGTKLSVAAPVRKMEGMK